MSRSSRRPRHPLAPATHRVQPLSPLPKLRPTLSLALMLALGLVGSACGAAKHAAPVPDQPGVQEAAAPIDAGGDAGAGQRPPGAADAMSAPADALALAIPRTAPGAAAQGRSPSGNPQQLSEALMPTPLWSDEEDADDEEAETLPPAADPRGESYRPIVENPFQDPLERPLSTFGVDVDSASYSNLRRFVEQMGQLPPPDAVRVEELVNAFRYDYPAPAPGAEHPFDVHVEVADAPWAPEHRLVKIGIQAERMNQRQRPDANLVFLIDVSGSMADANKLPLVKEALGLLVQELGDEDRVAMVTYAGESGLALESTPARRRDRILAAIDQLAPGGGTDGGGGIQLAYRVAREQFREGRANRVILLTDGDFNLGITDVGSLENLIQAEAADGVFLTVLGFGMGNLQDGRLEALADRGNGQYGYIDGREEAERLLVSQLSGTLVTVAKDVKLQVEFNPAQVAAYRLIGYENRRLRSRDFDDDAKDAGDIGAGHSVTALYELVPARLDEPSRGLRYQDHGRAAARTTGGDELFFLRLRYKEPDGQRSRLLEAPVRDRGDRLSAVSADFHFAAALAAYGMQLRDSEYRGATDLDLVRELAEAGLDSPYRAEREDFIDLLRTTQRLARY